MQLFGRFSAVSGLLEAGGGTKWPAAGSLAQRLDDTRETCADRARHLCVNERTPTMGQQQLILLVLGIVIVGVAVTIGIQAFSENSKKTNMDALMNDAIDVASDAQTWMLKPSVYGGANNSCRTACDWSGITLAAIGFSVSSSGTYSNVNGEITLDGSSNSSQVTITATSASYGNQVVVTVTGVDPADISSSVDPDYTS